MSVNLSAEYRLAFRTEIAVMQVVYLALEPSFFLVGCFQLLLHWAGWGGGERSVLTNSQFLLLLLGCQQVGAFSCEVQQPTKCLLEI